MRIFFGRYLGSVRFSGVVGIGWVVLGRWFVRSLVRRLVGRSVHRSIGRSVWGVVCCVV